MQRNRQLIMWTRKLIFLLLCFPFISFAQNSVNRYEINLKESVILPTENLMQELVRENAESRSKYDLDFWLYLQFYDIPGLTEIQELKEKGIELKKYISGNTYLAQISNQKFRSNVKIQQVRASFQLPNEVKVSPHLIDKMNHNQEVNSRIHFLVDAGSSKLRTWLEEANIQLLDDRLFDHGWVDVKINTDQINHVKSFPEVLSIDIKPVDEEIRYEAETLERANVLTNSSFRDIHGAGVVVGVGDGGKIGPHVDFGERVTNFSSFGYSQHATHVAGIIGGFPNLKPKQGSGIANRTTLISNNFSDIIILTPQYIQDYGMVVTNNSYGSNLGNCTLIGDYTISSALIDQQMNEYPELLHIYSAGNDGRKTCAPYPLSFATIAGGYQVAKNALTVGSCTQFDAISDFSARGPVYDGRIKPEIVAQGSSVNSTRPNNLFGNGGGTSYSGPAITGVATLMYDRYRQINGGANPGGDLVKALLCNSADDLGNPGPDYFWGFGRVNAKRAVEMMEEERYERSTITQGALNIHTVNVPAGVKQLKVMVLWSDEPAVPYVLNALVNDLDLEVIAPDNSIHFPWVLNPMPENVSDPAIKSTDHSNNYEQVTIDLPPAGNYQIEIEGYSIPIGMQPYVLTYDFVMDEIELTYPIGGEKFASDAGEYIRWDAAPTSNNFTLEYSLDHGMNWITINDEISSNQRYYAWTPPFVESDSVLFRISENNTILQDMQALPLSIMPRVGNLTATNICAGTVAIDWDTVPEASAYSVYTIIDGEMEVIQTTTNTSDTIYGLDESKDYWWSVSADHASGVTGRRQNAVNTGPSSGLCSFNNDIRLLSIEGPINGRQSTSSELSITEPLDILVVNNGNIDVSSIPLSYTVNGGAVGHDTISFLPQGDTISFTFADPINLSGVNAYSIVVWSSHGLDPVPVNDTLSKAIKHVPNASISLPHAIGFEGADIFELLTDDFALPGLEFLDYSSNGGRIRSFAGSGFIHQGDRAITLDANSYGSQGENELLLTLNLSAYDALTNDVRFNFSMMHHELIPDNDSLDLIWIRGSDTSSWIVAYDLFAHYEERGKYFHEILGVEISTLLEQNSQNFSSSFQMRFGQEGSAQADEAGSQDGYTIDDLLFYEVSSDVQLVQVISPKQNGCGLGNEHIEIQIRNASNNLLTGVQATFSGDGQSPITESVGDLAAGQVVDYTFTNVIDLSSLGEHNIDVWISHVADGYRINDSILNVKVIQFPEISSYPYLETFESGSGGWFSNGVNSSWELGKPGNTFIDHSAKGKNAWVTNLDGNHNADEISFLYSPCFEISSLIEPALSFGHIYMLENNYDYSWVEYSQDGGVTWDTLGSPGDGVNWYNEVSVNAWDNYDSNWHTATISLPTTSPVIQFRFVLSSDVGVENEGVGVDNVYLYDRSSIYQDVDTSSVMQVAGTDWISFEVMGNSIASIHPDGQNLGTVTMEVAKNEGPIRNTGNAYLLDRNWVVNATGTISTPVGVRLFFTDEEAEALLAANDCADCIRPDDAFRFTLIHYSGSNEDSIWSNNSGHHFDYLIDSVRMIPYDYGYFAEVWVDSFSEFWISSVPARYRDSICVQVSASTDDAEEHPLTGAINPYSEVLEMTETNINQLIGLRFPNVQIPSRSFITSAYLQFTSAAISSGMSDVFISGLSNGSSVASFNTANYNISERTKTLKQVGWTVAPWTSIGANSIEQKSPDISILVQEAVNGTSWTPGSALGFMIYGTGTREAFSFEGNSTYAAKLIIEYDSICNRAGRLYVDQNALGSNDGTDWVNAYTSLQEALIVSNSCPDIGEIWVRQGVYPTSEFNERDHSFSFERGIRIFGGFDGSEMSPDDRDLVNNVSYLDGNIGSLADSTDNAYHILVTKSPSDTVVLDGFHVVNGLANGTSIFQDRGAGLYNVGNVHLRNIVFEQIDGLQDGFVIFSFLTDAKMVLEECEIRLNGKTSPLPILNTSDSRIIIKGTNVIQK